MNKLFVMLLLLAGVAGYGQHKNYLTVIGNDWKKNGLNGRVKKIINVDSVSKGSGTVTETEFNEQGFTIGKIYTITRLADSGKKFVTASTITYDTIRNITRVEGFIQGEKSEEDTYEYNANGQLIKVTYTSLNKKGQLLLKTFPDITTKKIIYDKKNRLLKEMNFAGDSLLNRTDWEYLPDGNRRSTYRDGKRMLKKSEITECDTLRTEIRFDAGEKPERVWVYRKDAHGNVFYFQSSFFNGKLISHGNDYYDDHNNGIKSEYYLGDQKTPETTFTWYRYDSLGNWTRMKGGFSRQIIYW
jgi:hypothetical protein